MGRIELKDPPSLLTILSHNSKLRVSTYPIAMNSAAVIIAVGG